MRGFITMLAVAALATGCGPSNEGPTTFVLAWSEYPSWSVFGVAHEKKLIDGAAGKMGPVEEKWNVDIELREADYDSCIQMYGTGACDAVCITNMDILASAMQRPGVAVLPTSTSNGADACIAVGIDDVAGLKGVDTYGLESSVSQYCFVRGLQAKGLNPDEFSFKNMDPGEAAKALQTGQEDVKAIVVWNPFVLQTLKTQPNAKVLFDSSSIPGEIVDMVVVAKSSLEKPGGKAFAHAVIDTFYRINGMLENPKTADDTLVAIGAKFSTLGLEEMKQVVTQTVFYESPGKAVNLFSGAELPETMKTVVDFCVKHEMVTGPLALAFGSATGSPHLLFDPSYIREVEKKQE